MTTDIKENSAKSKSAITVITSTKSAAPVAAAAPPSPPSDSPPPRKPRRLLCRKEVDHRVGISRATTYRYVQRTREGTFDFPLPVQIGLGRIGWHEHEIDAWIDGRPRTADD